MRKLLFELKVHLQWVSKDSTGPKTVPCGTPDTKLFANGKIANYMKIMQMAKYIKII